MVCVTTTVDDTTSTSAEAGGIASWAAPGLGMVVTGPEMVVTGPEMVVAGPGATDVVTAAIVVEYVWTLWNRSVRLTEK